MPLTADGNERLLSVPSTVAEAQRHGYSNRTTGPSTLYSTVLWESDTDPEAL